MVIGITGGIGAGKSSVMNVLQTSYKAKLIIADNVAKSLMKPGTDCYEKVIEEFGKEILFEIPENTLYGTSNKPIKPGIDSSKLSDIVFNNPEKLKKLNDIVHPEVKKEILQSVSDIYEMNDEALIVLEAALLIEEGYQDVCDELWVVTAEKEVRIERLMQSRKYSREKCESIIKEQLSDEEFLSYADFVLDNSKDIENTVRQIKEHLKAEHII